LAIFNIVTETNKKRGVFEVDSGVTDFRDFISENALNNLGVLATIYT